MKDLRITLIQAAPVWEDRAANLALFTRLCGAIRRGATDLIILPEMFTTGFSMNAQALAESMRGPAVAWMRETAGKKNAVVCGSLIIKEKGKYFNRFVWMTPGGIYKTYDKRHLFSMAGEEKTYTPGRKKLIVSLKGWRICPLICYDLRFPVWSRQHPSALYDLLIYVASWPRRRRKAWQQLLPARAIENQCYVAGVTRTGRDGEGIDHAGDSAVCDPLGEQVSRGRAGTRFVETVTLSGRFLLHTRKGLPFLNDADRFKIRLP